MRVKGWKISIVLGLLLLAAALYLWGHNRWESNRAGEASAEVLAALKVEITSPAPVPTPTINPEYLRRHGANAEEAKSEQLIRDNQKMTESVPFT